MACGGPGDPRGREQRGAVGAELNDAVGVEAARLTVEQAWAGPLPAPGVLEQYERVLPGAAERILRMAETVATGNIRVTERQAEAEIRTAQRGQLLAAALTLAAMTGAGAFFLLGNQVAGIALLSLPLLMLIRSFLMRS
ncbi:DUF2335 domain-containing protein [Streptomyces alkaliphilus]|uniref:DUF2335 domain-containing protein n=1 Tax=Streptomyces alkaliphilus TaxID=1472722 RepID=A0A7W3TFH1_9ACTN|nr:DUF2335 domain-containing protein [Streptomyces alkaliphilus]